MTIITITLRTRNEVSYLDVYRDIVHAYSIKSSYLQLTNFVYLNISGWSWGVTCSWVPHGRALQAITVE